MRKEKLFEDDSVDKNPQFKEDINFGEDKFIEKPIEVTKEEEKMSEEEIKVNESKESFMPHGENIDIEEDDNLKDYLDNKNEYYLKLRRVVEIKNSQIDHDISQILSLVSDIQKKIEVGLTKTNDYGENRFRWSNKYGQNYTIEKYFEMISELRSILITLRGQEDNISKLSQRMQQNIDDLNRAIKK